MDTIAAETATSTAPAAAARRLYNAKVALHDAHGTGVDAWIAAAGDRLHDALIEHLRLAAAGSAGRR